MSRQKKKKNETCFDICLEEKKNETVGLIPTFLAQEITRDAWYKMIAKTITQIRDKTTNSTQDQIEFEGWK